MALIIADPFDQYASIGQVSRLWTVGSAPTFGASSGRFGGGGVSAAFWGVSIYLDRAVGQTGPYVVGGAFRPTALPTGATNLLFGYDTTTAQAGVTVEANGTLQARRAVTAVGAPSVQQLAINTWYWIEMKVNPHPTAGSIEVRVNNEVWLNLTNQNLRQTTNSYFTSIRVTVPQGTLDDLYILDGAAGLTDFLGDCRFRWLKTNADTAQKDFSRLSGNDNFAMVADASGADDDTSYNFSSTVGHRDLFELEDLATAPAAIHAVMALNLVRKSDAGARSARQLIQSNGTDALGAVGGLSTSYGYLQDVYRLNPDGNVAWTATAINALRLGYEVAA